MSSVYRGPFTSPEELLKSFKAIKFISGFAANCRSFGNEGLAQALVVLDEMSNKRKAYQGRNNVGLSQFIIYIANSEALDLPVMDVREHFGKEFSGNYQVFLTLVNISSVMLDVFVCFINIPSFVTMLVRTRFFFHFYNTSFQYKLL